MGLKKGLPVNVFSVPKLHHEDAQCAVLNITNDPAVADTIAPKSAKRAGQCFSGTARVIQWGDALVHVIDNPAGRWFIRLARKTPPFRAGMDSADGRAVLFNGGSAAARCTAE